MSFLLNKYKSKTEIFLAEIPQGLQTNLAHCRIICKLRAFAFLINPLLSLTEGSLTLNKAMLTVVAVGDYIFAEKFFVI